MLVEDSEIPELQRVVDFMLNRSIERIAEYVAAKLPDGWEIEISFEDGHVYVRLFDPSFNEIDLGKMESPIREMCEFAIEIDKIDDARGVRNQQTLKRQGNLWYFPDDAMYVYYTPTHWAKTT